MNLSATLLLMKQHNKSIAFTEGNFLKLLSESCDGVLLLTTKLLYIMSGWVMMGDGGGWWVGNGYFCAM